MGLAERGPDEAANLESGTVEVAPVRIARVVHVMEQRLLGADVWMEFYVESVQKVVYMLTATWSRGVGCIAGFVLDRLILFEMLRADVLRHCRINVLA